MTMHLTLDQYLDGFENTVVRLPDVLAAWKGTHEVLREEYTDSLRWMLTACPEILRMARAKGRSMEVTRRLKTATTALWKLRGPLKRVMGIDKDNLRWT